RTPFAVEKEVESYPVTLAHIDRSGNATFDYFTFLVDLDTGSVLAPYDPDGTVDVRVPKGRYAVGTEVFDEIEGDILLVSDLVQPVLDVSRPLTVTLDARTAGSIDVKLPRKDAASETVSVMYSFATGKGL